MGWGGGMVARGRRAAGGVRVGVMVWERVRQAV